MDIVVLTKAQAGDEQAENQLIQENKGLVGWAMKPYLDKAFAAGLTPDDLMAEGMIGLLKALRRFDPKKGFQFSTYAMYWIKQRFLRLMVEFSYKGPLKDRALKLLNKYHRRVAVLQNRLGRTVNYEEVLQRMRATKKEKALIKQLLTFHMVSLQQPLGEELSLEETVASDLPAPSHGVLASMKTMQLLSHLSEREQFILTHQWGLGVAQETNMVIAKQLGINGSRVRDIGHRAERKLRYLMIQEKQQQRYTPKEIQYEKISGNGWLDYKKLQ